MPLGSLWLRHFWAPFGLIITTLFFAVFLFKTQNHYAPPLESLRPPVKITMAHACLSPCVARICPPICRPHSRHCRVWLCQLCFKRSTHTGTSRPQCVQSVPGIVAPRHLKTPYNRKRKKLTPPHPKHNQHQSGLTCMVYSISRTCIFSFARP